MSRSNSHAKELWRCSVCGRRFAKRNQAHSCQARSIVHHFQGKSQQLRVVFDTLCQSLRQAGPLRLDAVKSSINLVSRHHFGGVVVRKDHLRLGFLADHEIRSPRLFGVERLGPRRFAYHVALHSPADLDAELLGWLCQAQALHGHRV